MSRQAKCQGDREGWALLEECSTDGGDNWTLLHWWRKLAGLGATTLVEDAGQACSAGGGGRLEAPLTEEEGWAPHSPIWWG